MEVNYKFAPSIPSKKILSDFGHILFPDLRKQVHRKLPRTCLAGIALVNDKVIGLVIGIKSSSENKVKIVSFAVASAFRHQGIGSKLLEVFSSKSKESGHHILSLHFREHWKSSEYLMKILVKQNWQTPQIQIVMVEGVIKNILKLFKSDEEDFPDGFEFITWANLSSEDLTALRKTASENKIPINQDPFLSENTINISCSKVLFYNGKIVGWLMSHIISDKTNEFTSFYLSPTFRKYRIGHKMISDVIHTQHKIRKHPNFVIVARKENKIMSSLMLRHAQGTRLKLVKTYYSEKQNIDNQ